MKQVFKQAFNFSQNTDTPHSNQLTCGVPEEFVRNLLNSKNLKKMLKSYQYQFEFKDNVISSTLNFRSGKLSK